jgi:DGQHR domain-containing protein
MHRAKAAIEAIKIDHTLAREEVPVVLIPYEGPTQVRQLFSDLNLNAKPVSRTIGYDFESRDPVVVISKEAASQVPLFTERINRRSNSLPRSSSDVITLSTLVQGSRWILESLASKNADADGDDHDESIEPFTAYLADREKATRELADVWHVMSDVFSEQWRDVMNNVDGAAGLVREHFLFAHGLGWLGLSKAASELIAAYDGGWEAHFRKAVGSFDWQRTDPVWVGNAVLFNEETEQYRVNNTAPAVKDLAARIVNKA